MRKYAKFGVYSEFDGGDATAQHIGKFIDFAARDIFELPINDLSIQPMDWKDDGRDKALIEVEPITIQVWWEWEVDSSPSPVFDPGKRIDVSPERRKYSDGFGRYMLVVFGIADQRLFIWKLGGL
jgi:hypothetical protein